MTLEGFCPILAVITIDDIEEIIKFICHRDQPLALYYFGATRNNKRLDMVTTKKKLGTRNFCIKTNRLNELCKNKYNTEEHFFQNLLRFFKHFCQKFLKFFFVKIW
jgi:hypothetical protein